MTETAVPEPVQRAVEKWQPLSADKATRALAEDRERALITGQLARNALVAEAKAREARGEANTQQRIVQTLLDQGVAIETVTTYTGPNGCRGHGTCDGLSSGFLAPGRKAPFDATGTGRGGRLTRRRP